ncbi:MAG TPA: sigma-70 family RNA polymerase sigma factor [Candidatus Acidoferrum sp.]|jgi:RNA polymerase sigma factor (sigma-70 family)|nr:sigma-70 family RNA polymerase sigma factor [Candidatus Acidoferrum sp.]
MADDRQLLHRFAEERSEAAFGELVTRHLPLVYSTAIRQAGGDEHLAKDVAQVVFTDFARKAPSLSKDVILAGWLHRATIFAARQILRGDRRRREREQQAVTMNAPSSDTENDWQQIRPLLDEALDRLSKADRDALLLRFFEQQSFAQIGANLGGSEDAARKRITRALEKLRTILQRHGVATTAAALSTVMSANAIQTVPAGLAAALTNTSLATAATGTTFTLLKIMTATQIKLGLGALVVAGAATALVIQHQAQSRLLAENQSLRQQLAQLQSDDEDLSNRLADAGDAKKLSDEQFNELLRLRGQVGRLRQQTNELGESQSSLENSLQEVLAHQPEDFNSASNEERQTAIAKINDARSLAMQFILYASDNQGFVPTNHEQLSSYNNHYPISGTNHFEVEYQGSMNAITNPSSVILVQSDPWETYEGKWAKAYGFADGHAEVHAEANGDFTGFEQQHSVSPPTSP